MVPRKGRFMLEDKGMMALRSTRVFVEGISTSSDFSMAEQLLSWHAQRSRKSAIRRLILRERCPSQRYLKRFLSTSSPNKNQKLPNLALKAGAPFVLFSVLAAWVVSNALDGKLREMEASQGKVSKSLRQAKMEEEHDEMMERLNKIVASDFDNTKRIKRPHEVLEERRLERERRNAWYNRLYRRIVRPKETRE